MAGSVAPKILTHGLVLYLDAANRNSYVSGSTTWSDMSAVRNSGTLINGPVFTSTNGGSLVFDGVDDYIRTDSNTALDLNGDYTISVWLGTATTADKAIVQRYLSSGAFPGYAISLNRSTVGKVDLFTGGTWYTNKGANINNGTWTNIVFTVSGTSAVFYQDGAGTAFAVNASNSNPSDNLYIGATEGTGNFLLGNIAIVQIYNKALTADQVIRNYNTLRTRFVYGVLDTDAIAFISAAGITDPTQQSAIFTLVLDLKSYGIWTKMKAIYPMVGGTETAHKFNLKNPLDTNAAFRLLFTGTWVHSATGAKPNGITGYADTFLVPNTDLTLNGAGISYYAREIKSVSFNKGALMGAGTGTSELSFFVDYNDSKDYIANNNAETTGVLLLGKTGLFHNTRITSTGYKVYNNGTINYNITSNSVGRTTSGIQIARVNGYGDLTDVECAFAAIDTGLTDTEAANLYTAVQAYQTTLGRQV